MRHAQFQSLNRLGVTLFCSARRKKFRSCGRPTAASPAAAPRVWWGYAVRSVVMEVREERAVVDLSALKEEAERRWVCAWCVWCV
jgi:hypothetical protein